MIAAAGLLVLDGSPAAGAQNMPPSAISTAAKPTIPPATIDDTLEIEGESVAARLAATRLSVGVMIDGKGPFRFAVDSGADRSVIGQALARQLGLPPGDRVSLHSTTGTTLVDTVRIGTLKIGASEIGGISAPALPERFVGAQGLLGIDALADQRLLLDFDGRTITVQDTRRIPAPPKGEDEIVVTARRRNGQLILTQASAGRVPIYAIIDSGSEVTVGNMALRDRIFARRKPPPATPVEIVSVTGGKATADLIVLPELRIGGILLQNVPIAFFESPPFALFGLAHDPAILLGTDILRSFSRVGLDFRGRKVRFRLRHQPSSFPTMSIGPQVHD